MGARAENQTGDQHISDDPAFPFSITFQLGHESIPVRHRYPPLVPAASASRYNFIVYAIRASGQARLFLLHLRPKKANGLQGSNG